MTFRSARDEEASMRNWSLKEIAGFRKNLEKIRLSAPETVDASYRLVHNLNAMEEAIRAYQALQPSSRPKAEKRKRIWVK